MSLLNVSKETAEKMKNLESISLDKLIDYEQGRTEGGDDIKIALQSFKIVTANRQTANSHAALIFNMICALTDDSEVRREYLKQIQPDLNLKKLPGKNKKTA